MNSKFLYAVTIAVSLVSTLALADEAPLTREQVKAEARKAALEGTLRHPDFDLAVHRPQTPSTLTREQVVADLKRSPAVGIALIAPEEAGYHDMHPQSQGSSTLTRSEVQDEVRQAVKDGTLPHPDDSEATLWSARRLGTPTAAPTVSQRGKAKALDSGT